MGLDGGDGVGLRCVPRDSGETYLCGPAGGHWLISLQDSRGQPEWIFFVPFAIYNVDGVLGDHNLHINDILNYE